MGALNAELWRAIRLVVDTGLHAKGWSRQDVLDYMYANSAVKPARAISEAERFMAIPGQALAYKVGQLKMRAIRASAEERLGDLQSSAIERSRAAMNATDDWVHMHPWGAVGLGAGVGFLIGLLVSRR